MSLNNEFLLELPQELPYVNNPNVHWTLCVLSASPQAIGGRHFATGIHVNSDHDVVLLCLKRDPNLEVFFDRVRKSMILILSKVESGFALHYSST